MIQFNFKFRQIFLFIFLCASGQVVFASETDDSESIFEEGSVVMLCTKVDGYEISESALNEALPKWLSTLQTLADDGVVVRAHFLRDFKGGIFVVIAGDTREIAMNNAVLTSYQLSNIFVEATGLKNVNTCTFTEIGPVAILPTGNK